MVTESDTKTPDLATAALHLPGPGTFEILLLVSLFRFLLCVCMLFLRACRVPLRSQKRGSDGYEAPFRCWELNPGTPEEQQVLLIRSHLSSLLLI